MELQLERPWTYVKDRMKEHDAALTDDDLQYEKGKDDELLARLSVKMNRSKEEVKEWIESLSFNR